MVISKKYVSYAQGYVLSCLGAGAWNLSYISRDVLLFKECIQAG